MLPPPLAVCGWRATRRAGEPAEHLPTASRVVFPLASGFGGFSKSVAFAEAGVALVGAPGERVCKPQGPLTAEPGLGVAAAGSAVRPQPTPFEGQKQNASLPGGSLDRPPMSSLSAVLSWGGRVAKGEEKRASLQSLHGARAGRRPAAPLFPSSSFRAGLLRPASRKPCRPRGTFEHQVLDVHAQRNGAGSAQSR